MQKEVYYVKSFEEDFATKSLKNNKKVDCQTIFEVIKSKILKPNTKSFGREKRLSCTIISKQYTKTYRPQGLIFQTEERPDYIFPCDLVLLSATDKIIVHYYRIKNNLHVYYNHTLIKGFEKFIFKNFKSMAFKFASPEQAWGAINKFRTKNGYHALKKQKYRLVLYNEAVFHKAIKIKPIAIFGYRKEARAIAKRLNLPHYLSTKEFYEKKIVT